ncbi:MAG: TIGR01459 family HAD-type hydrolase [Pseudomonadota bacterium]
MLSTSGSIVPGLSSLADRYDAILCDVWGVIHNGVSVFPGSVEALDAYRKRTGKPVVLITNAPRPSPPIVEQLHELGVPRTAFDDIVTSGDVTADLIRREGIRKVNHIGPVRDHSLFDELGIERVAPGDTDTIVCTGLIDDTVETPEDYRDMLQEFIDAGQRMICANPDIVVERGNTLIYCAGALAALYETLGGETIRLGKPYAPIYEGARERIRTIAGDLPPSERILAIGDGMFTDIKGANQAGLSALFVTSGIHSDDFGSVDAPDPARIADRLETEGLQAAASIVRLRW